MDEKGGQQPPPPYSEAAQGYAYNNTGYAAAPGDFTPSAPAPGPQYGFHQMQPYPNQQNFQQNQNMNTMVVTHQPTSMNQVVNHVPDNMGLAIFATIFCFWPVGIIAIMRASESRSALLRGDLAAAQASAQDSRRMSIIAMVVGSILLVTVIIVVAVVVTRANSCYYCY